MSKVLQSSIVSFHKSNGLIVGTGFLASSKYILTCAHVVTDALGISRDAIPSKGSLLKVTFQLRRSRESYEAKLIHCLPPLLEPTYGKAEDIALLEIDSNLESYTIPIIIEEQIFDKDFRVYGFPTDKGEWLKGEYIGINAYNWIELDLKKHNAVGGFSGAPVWDNEKEGVSGLMVAGTNEQKAYMIPMKSILETFKELDEELVKEKNPYKGLLSFGYEDKTNYFGREKEAQTLAEQLQSTRFFTLLGTSGSGKSSLLFAGIVPLLKSENTQILHFKPREKPFRELANIFIPYLYHDKLEQIEQKEKLALKLMNYEIKLSNLTESFLETTKAQKLYIMIDQFEELFTLSKDNSIKKKFIKQLMELLESNLNTTLIISMRIDFLSFVSSYQDFIDLINQNPKTILGMMSPENLHRAIELPAKNLGVKFEEGLIERILEEIQEGEGKLPLLEFALEQLWEKMYDRMITHKSLDEIQNISHAISHYADDIYNQYRDNQESIKRVFLKLIHSGNGTQDTRRVALFDDFDTDDRETITLLATTRLIITKEQSVEIVHEALIREWQILKNWIDEYREFLEWEKRLRSDLALYSENGKKEDDLLRDSKLLRAREFLDSYTKEISHNHREFIEKSSEVDKRKKRNKKIIIGTLFIILLLIIGMISHLWIDADRAKKEAIKMSTIAKTKEQEAIVEKNRARQSEIKALKTLQDKTIQEGISLRDDKQNPLKAKFVFAKAVTQSVSLKREDRSKIFYNSIQHSIKLKNILKHNDSVNGVAYSNSEQRIVSWSRDGRVKLWDTQSGKALFVLQHDKAVYGAVFSKNEKNILIWDEDGTVKLWDTQSSKELFTLKHKDAVYEAKFSQDEKFILSWGKGSIVTLWDTQSSQELLALEHTGLVNGVTLSQDEKVILTWSHNTKDNKSYITLWDRQSGKELLVLKHNEGAFGAKFNKNEQSILSWGKDGTVKLWDRESAKELLSLKHDKSVYGATFSQDEKLILSWSKDGTVKLWDRESSKELLVLKHDREVLGATFSQDEKLILSWSPNGTVKLWDRKSGQRLLLLKHPGWVNGVALSQDGKVIYSWGSNSKDKKGNVALWDSKSGKKLQVLEHNDEVYGCKFNQDETLMVCGSGAWKDKRGNVTLWSNDNTQKLRTLQHNQAVYGVDYSKDGKLILSWGRDGTVKLWDSQSGKKLLILQHNSRVYGANFTHDEKHILSWSRDATARLWDSKSGKNLLTLQHKSRVHGATFSKDEKFILCWTRKGNIKLWESKSGKEILAIKQNIELYGATFSKDEKRILSWGYNWKDDQSYVTLWDRKSGKELLISKHDCEVIKAKFSKDEKTIHSLCKDGNSIKLWNETDGNVLLNLKHNRSVNGAQFTKDENILSWSQDGTVRLWDKKSGNELLLLKHNSSVNGAKFNKDANAILSWSEDGTVKLRDRESGKELLSFKHDHAVFRAKLTQDEKTIMSWDTNGTIKLTPLYQERKLPNQYYLLEAEVESGVYLDTYTQELKILSKKEWEAKKAKYDTIIKENNP